MAKATEKTRRLVQMSILIAIMLILAFTPLGYLKVGAIEITFMTIPVVVGAILLGPASGGKTKILSFAVSSLSGAVLNTVFFVTMLMLLFGSSDYMMSMRGGMGLLSFLAAFVGINGLVEAIVAFILGTAISKALVQFLPQEKQA